MARPSTHPETIALIVADYERHAERRAQDAAWWRADGEPFREVLDRVGRAELFGKRHGHQYRLSRAALESGRQALHEIADALERAPDFHSLWVLVHDAFEPIRGLGELAIYDTAERLRYRLHLEAPHLIYLHAGARVGARRLMGGRLRRDEAWGILRHQLPEGFWNLATHAIEDILCTYKDALLLTPDEARVWLSSHTSSGCHDQGERGGC